MKKIFNVICLILVLFASVGCDKNLNQKTIDNYKYGIILSNQQKDGELQLYDENGNFLDKVKVPASGIDENGSAYLNGPQYNNGKWYIGCSSSFKIQDFLLEIDSDSLDIKKIPSNIKGYQYTGFLDDDEYMYTFYSTPDKGACIVKSNKSNGEIIGQTEIKNSILFHMIPYDDKIILVSDSDETDNNNTTIRVLNTTTLDIESEYSLEGYLFVKDLELVGSKLYMIPFLHSNDTLSNEVIIYDLNDNSIESIELPFKDLRYIDIVSDKLYVCEQNLDSDNSSIAIIDLNKNEVTEVIDLEYTLREIIVGNNTITTCSDDTVYVYDINNFNPINSFDIKTSNSLMFGGLLIK